MAEAGKPLFDEEALARLQAELERIRVSDLLLQTCATLSSIGYARMEGERRDLGDARLAIDALRALAPVLEGAVPETVSRELRQAVATMQLAFAGRITPVEEDKADGGS